MAGSDKIRRELGWVPSYSFEEGLLRTVQWYVDHPEWCAAVQAENYGRERLGLGSRSGAVAGAATKVGA